MVGYLVTGYWLLVTGYLVGITAPAAAAAASFFFTVNIMVLSSVTLNNNKDFNFETYI